MLIYEFNDVNIFLDLPYFKSSGTLLITAYA